MHKAVNINISGRVQGVGYRYFTLQNAHSLGLTGFVKNNYDGSVSAFAQGEAEAVNHFIQFLKKGPAFSQVRQVDVTCAELKENITDFKIKT